MTDDEIDISVITPSLNMLSYLERCVAAVADQKGVRVEHLVMDGGSRDGTAEWLAARPWLASEVRSDNGMYEAINRGFRRARGRVLAHINCDEQYLPGTLATVLRYFDAHPEVDVLFGDHLMVRPDGSLISYRKCVRPVSPMLSVKCCWATATTFFRRKLVDEGVLYDDSYKDIADQAWYVRIAEAGYRLAHVNQYLATSAITGSNRALVVSTITAEMKRFSQSVPWWIKRFRLPWLFLYWGQKAFSGCYSQATPLQYAIYEPGDMSGRTLFVAQRPSYRWRLALSAAEAARRALREGGGEGLSV
jgi:glycosyltransferase involved in cell wall biosynthesis